MVSPKNPKHIVSELHCKYFLGHPVDELTELLDIADHALSPTGHQVGRGPVGGGAGGVTHIRHALVHVLDDAGESGGSGVGGAAARGRGISQTGLGNGHRGREG